MAYTITFRAADERMAYLRLHFEEEMFGIACLTEDAEDLCRDVLHAVEACRKNPVDASTWRSGLSLCLADAAQFRMYAASVDGPDAARLVEAAHDLEQAFRRMVPVAFPMGPVCVGPVHVL